MIALEDRTAIVHAAGDVDLHSAPALSARFKAAFAETDGAIVIDLTDVGFIDSTGLSVLLNALRRMTRARRPLALAVSPGPVAQTLAITRLDSTFRVFGSAEEAARRIGPPSRDASAADG